MNRRYLSLFVLIASLIAGPMNVHAHAVVTEYSLQHKPIEPNQATEVALFFNSNVELALSKIFVVSKGDVYHSVEMTRGKKKGEVIVHVPALEEGDYALKYKVFAADGHLTEDVIRFHVANHR